MKRNIFITITVILPFLILNSCIFQNDPVRPNIPPTIESFSPQSNDTVLYAPTDMVSFDVWASDLDGDELTYEFVVSTISGSVVDSMLSSSNSADFFAIKGDRYHIQARVRDGGEQVSVNWYVEVIEDLNEPPVIKSFLPDMESFSCLLMRPVEFRISALDENPEYLRYKFLVKGVNTDYESKWIKSSYISHSFVENGDYQVTGIVWDWEYSDSVSWSVNVTGDPDTVNPGVINDLEGWTGDLAGSIFLQWTAPGDDGDDGIVFGYKIKTSTVPIITESDWSDASYKYGTPDPGPPGTVETMTAFNCYPGTNLYVTARALDDFGNLGPMGNCISLLVRGYDMDGHVYDAGTGETAGDMMVSAGMLVADTDPSGYYFLSDLPKYAQVIRIRDEAEHGILGDYYDFLSEMEEINADLTIDFYMLPAYPVESCVEGRYDDFLILLKDMTDTEGLLERPTVYYGWDHWPLTIYNPPMIYNDVDIQEVARGSMASWEDGTGLDLFTETAYPEVADVKIVYYYDGQLKHHVETVEENPDGTPKKKEIRIYLLNTLSPIDLKGHMIFAHELGHVVGLKHSLDPGHLMIGMTAPYIDDPSIDELRLLKVIYHLPAIFDSDWFIAD
ncbi:MAG: hypothetical protein JW814_09650 [Candidatus Krumholzibacteriota bacterium]|nr:hypothetical protein [Candidatus Krumholzibacteriota bacterium]